MHSTGEPSGEWRSMFHKPVPEAHVPLHKVDDWRIPIVSKPHDGKILYDIDQDQPTASCSGDDESSYYSSNESSVFSSIDARDEKEEEQDEESSFYTAESDIRSQHQQQNQEEPKEESRREEEVVESELDDDPTVTDRLSHILTDSDAIEAYKNDHNYRFLFNKYWKNRKDDSRSPEIPHQICIPGSITVSSPNLIVPTLKETQRVSVIKNEPDVPFQIHCTKRRSIFGEQCYAQKQAPPVLEVREEPRLVELVDEGAKSSLRPCRYSGEIRRSSSTNLAVKHSVSFSDKTEIALYEKPVEQYDNKGWFDFFA